MDQLINFSHFGMDYLPSDVDDDSYDLTSELFLENVDDAFMPNFPSSISSPASPSSWSDSSRRRPRNTAMMQRINSARQRNSPGSGRRRSPDIFQPMIVSSHSRESPIFPPPVFLLGSPSLTRESPATALDSSPASSPSRNILGQGRNPDEAVFRQHNRGRSSRFRRPSFDQRQPVNRHLR